MENVELASDKKWKNMYSVNILYWLGERQRAQSRIGSLPSLFIMKKEISFIQSCQVRDRRLQVWVPWFVRRVYRSARQDYNVFRRWRTRQLPN